MTELSQLRVDSEERRRVLAETFLRLRPFDYLSVPLRVDSERFGWSDARAVVVEREQAVGVLFFENEVRLRQFVRRREDFRVAPFEDESAKISGRAILFSEEDSLEVQISDLEGKTLDSTLAMLELTELLCVLVAEHDFSLLEHDALQVKRGKPVSSLWPYENELIRLAPAPVSFLSGSRKAKNRAKAKRKARKKKR